MEGIAEAKENEAEAARQKKQNESSQPVSEATVNDDDYDNFVS